MKVIQLQEPGVWNAIELPAPKSEALQGNEALVKVLKIGICGTDLHAFKGRQPFFQYPRILGHELAVEVIALGKDVTHVRVGDRCAVEPYFNDLIGQAVRYGKPNCGEHLKVLGVHVDGGMREFFTLRAELLHPSKMLSNDELALVEPLAIGRHAVNRSGATSRDTVLVVGAGPIGLATAIFAQLTGAKVLVMDIDAEKLKMCKTITGITTLLEAKGDIEASLRALLDGDLPTVVLDATGSPQSMMDTFTYVSAGGTIVFVGLFVGNVTFEDPLFHKKELTLKASRCGLTQDFVEIIKLIENKTIKVTPAITHRLKFSQLVSEFEKLYTYKGALVKAIVDMD